MVERQFDPQCRRQMNPTPVTKYLRKNLPIDIGIRWSRGRRPNLSGTKSTDHLECDSWRRGLLTCHKNSRVKIMHANMWSPFLANISMILTLSCYSKKLSYLSWITLYIEHAISQWYSSPTRFSLHILILGVMMPLCENARSLNN